MADFQIVIAGFGGQGLLFSGKVLAYAGLLEGRELSWLPSYGPEMRGGTANCNVILSDTPVGSPIVQHPNVLMVMNNPSLDKYEDTVAPGGKIFVDSTLIGRKVRRTDVEAYYIPATGLAGEMGVPTLANMLLLDEPTNHLDLIYQKQIFALIGSWLREPGRAVVSVVHDLSLARSFGTDALLMDHGRQIAHGPAAQVLTPERLNAVYGMDVPAWMRSLYAQWAEDNEKAPLPGELARRSRD